MMSKSNYILGALLLIIFGLIGYIILSDPGNDVESFDETELRKQIALRDSVATFWEAEAESWHGIANEEQDKADSLELYKPKIIKYYEDQYNFNATASDMQLDSVIRANW